jgi:hypothetical protein
MPKMVDVWNDEDSIQFAIHHFSRNLQLDISGEVFTCTHQDAREIGKLLIRMADEIEAKQ